jgi:hypothetical protein
VIGGVCGSAGFGVGGVTGEVDPLRVVKLRWNIAAFRDVFPGAVV